MKKLITAILLALTFTIQGQTSTKPLLKLGITTGKVIDATLDEPLPYVTIVIKDSAENIINGSITDDNGFFKVNRRHAVKQLFIALESRHSFEAMASRFIIVSFPNRRKLVVICHSYWAKGSK